MLALPQILSQVCEDRHQEEGGERRSSSRCRADVMRGFNGTVFAYGQTSSGKTFTIEVRVIRRLCPTGKGLSSLTALPFNAGPGRRQQAQSRDHPAGD